MLRLVEHVSLDGVIEVGEGFAYGDWTQPYRSPAGLEAVLAVYGEHLDLLLGRRTYDLWSGYWPHAAPSPMASRLNSATKYVVTHRPESLPWGPCQGLAGNLAVEVQALKATVGHDIVTAGSSTLTSVLLAHGLVDELVLLVNPVLIGTGRRLFADGTPPCAFGLTESRAFPSGIIMNRYRAEGPLRNRPAAP
jgi:dihydrofolate reductase